MLNKCPFSVYPIRVYSKWCHIRFKEIKLVYNDYNYYKVIINYITKLSRNDIIKILMYSICQRKSCSYINMRGSI